MERVYEYTIKTKKKDYEEEASGFVYIAWYNHEDMINVVHKHLLTYYYAYGEIIDISISLTDGHGLVLVQPNYRGSDLTNDFVICLEIERKTTYDHY